MNGIIFSTGKKTKSEGYEKEDILFTGFGTVDHMDSRIFYLQCGHVYSRIVTGGNIVIPAGNNLCPTNSTSYWRSVDLV
jgi:hypothetical protein